MAGVSPQQFQRMGKKWKDDPKGAFGSPRAAGQIDDEALANGSAHGPAECGQGGLLGSRRAHLFREPLDDAFAYQSGRLGSDIALR